MKNILPSLLLPSVLLLKLHHAPLHDDHSLEAKKTLFNTFARQKTFLFIYNALHELSSSRAVATEKTEICLCFDSVLQLLNSTSS